MSEKLARNQAGLGSRDASALNDIASHLLSLGFCFLSVSCLEVARMIPFQKEI